MRRNVKQLAIGLALLVLASTTLSQQVVAQEQQDPPAKKSAKAKYHAPASEDQISVADGTVRELFQQMMKARFDVMQSQLEDKDSSLILVFTAMKVYDKIAAHPKATAEEKMEAALMKLAFLTNARQHDEKYGKVAKAFSDELIAKDPKGDIAGLIKMQALMQGFKAASFSNKDVDALVDLAKEYPNNKTYPRAFEMVADALNQAEKTAALDALVNKVKTATPDSPIAKSLERKMKAIELKRNSIAVKIGTELAIEGPTLSGSKFDIKKLRGKVVLVDFWATWCVPCVKEVPNLKKAYDKYHDKGFEIVSISLDANKEDLTKFVDEEKMNWTHIYFGDNGDNPLALKYQVEAIPAMFLVGKDGTVIQLANDLRGEGALENLLEPLLGEKSNKPTDK